MRRWRHPSVGAVSLVAFFFSLDIPFGGLDLRVAQAATAFSYQRSQAFYLTDHLGSTRLVTDGSGVEQARYAYYPFGELFAPPPRGEGGGEGEVSYLYTGQELDRSSELYYYGARYYDPSLALFVSIDPAREDLNLYNYVGNNPVKYLDPTGAVRLPMERIWKAVVKAVSRKREVAIKTTGGIVVGGKDTVSLSSGSFLAHTHLASREHLPGFSGRDLWTFIQRVKRSRGIQREYLIFIDDLKGRVYKTYIQGQRGRWRGLPTVHITYETPEGMVRVKNVRGIGTTPSGEIFFLQMNGDTVSYTPRLLHLQELDQPLIDLLKDLGGEASGIYPILRVVHDPEGIKKGLKRETERQLWSRHPLGSAVQFGKILSEKLSSGAGGSSPDPEVEVSPWLRELLDRSPLGSLGGH